MEKLEGGRPLEKPSRRWEDNIPKVFLTFTHDVISLGSTSILLWGEIFCLQCVLSAEDTCCTNTHYLNSYPILTLEQGIFHFYERLWGSPSFLFNVFFLQDKATGGES